MFLSILFLESLVQKLIAFVIVAFAKYVNWNILSERI